MARKSQPQPLTLPDNNVHREHEHIESPRTPLSLKSPKSPTSLFRFPTKKPITGQGAPPSMQTADAPHRHSELPQSQTLPTLNQYRSGEENQERDKTGRGGFFNNYKATKSQKSLEQNSIGETMSRDTDRPGMAERVVSGRESSKNSTSSTLLYRWSLSNLLMTVNNSPRSRKAVDTKACWWPLKIRCFLSFRYGCQPLLQQQYQQQQLQWDRWKQQEETKTI